MTTVDFITALFCRGDDAMTAVTKHLQAKLYPSEVVTVALLFALKGVGDRPFYRWLERDYRPLFSRLPERTRLFRLFATHQEWAERFMADPMIIGVADSYCVEVLHPYREKRHPRLGRIGRNKWGLVCAWGADTVNVHDSAFQPLVARFTEEMVVLADANFARTQGNPSNLKVCPRDTGNDRMLVETTFSIHVHAGLPPQEGPASRLALFYDALGLHGGPVQRVGRMGGPPLR